MTPIEIAETIVLLLAVGVALAWLARRIDVPDPVVLVAGGAVLAFLPLGIEIELDPELVLLLFVAPLLYAEGYYAPVRELRTNAVSIALLSSVLVVVTAVAVAVTAHYLLDIPWEVAFVLGAALGATDALAPVQVMDGVGADPRLEAVVQGESLFNDGVALALVSVAAAAAASGSFEPASASGTLALYVAGGIAVGLAVAWVVGKARQSTDHVLIEAGLSLITPFAAYIAAEVVHGSGILAAVAAGIWLGQRRHDVIEPLARVELQAAWQIIVFVLNSLLFLLVGLAAGDIIAAVERPAGEVIGAGLAITVVVVGVRMLWALTVAPAWRGAASRVADRVRPASPRAWRVALAWSGVRGSVALAAVLSLPTMTDADRPMPARDLIIVLTLVVIAVTLSVQGLTLRPLIKRLGLADPDGPEREELFARRAATDAALEQLEDAAGRHGLAEDELNWLKHEYMLRRGQAEADEDGAVAREALAAAEQTDLELLEVARQAVLDLEERGEVRSEVAQKVIRKLDLDSARLRN
jgi:CPA1 family monovalent cation:H+ antiporter